MDYKLKQEIQTKIEGGNVGLLPEYLDMLKTESLDKLKVCTPADLTYYQSRYSTLSEILNLLN